MSDEEEIARLLEEYRGQRERELADVNAPSSASGTLAGLRELYTATGRDLTSLDEFVNRVDTEFLSHYAA